MLLLLLDRYIYGYVIAVLFTFARFHDNYPFSVFFQSNLLFLECPRADMLSFYCFNLTFSAITSQ